MSQSLCVMTCTKLIFYAVKIIIIFIIILIISQPPLLCCETKVFLSIFHFSLFAVSYVSFLITSAY